MKRNLHIAAAVAAAVAGSGASFAAAPTVSTIAATCNAANATASCPNTTINIMGSSAIKVALTNSILTNFCGGASNATVITSNGSNTNFLGIACTPLSSAVSSANAGLNYNVWLRYEGGSVSGFLPIANATATGSPRAAVGYPVSEIDGPSLTSTGSTCSGSCPITVQGESTANGVDDSFTVTAGGALSYHIPDLGIGDVEPQALIGSNYPTAYSTTIWGPINPGGVFGLKAAGIMDEVYAVYVNEASSVFTETPLNLSRQMLAAILTHQVTNWSQVYDVNLKPVTAAASSLAIRIVNREQGSGSRAATDILLAGDGCGSGGNSSVTIFQPAQANYFSTGDVLKNANTVPGAVTYATIDNTQQCTSVAGCSTSAQSQTANLTWVTIEGVAPSNLAAAQGTYPFWVEAQYINNGANTGADQTAIETIVSGLQNGATTASIADVDAIPNIASALGGGLKYNGAITVHLNPASNVVTAGGGGTNLDGSTSTVYVNPYTRGGITCNNPVVTATQFP